VYILSHPLENLTQPLPSFKEYFEPLTVNYLNFPYLHPYKLPKPGTQTFLSLNIPHNPQFVNLS